MVLKHSYINTVVPTQDGDPEITPKLETWVVFKTMTHTPDPGRLPSASPPPPPLDILGPLMTSGGPGEDAVEPLAVHRKILTGGTWRRKTTGQQAGAGAGKQENTPRRRRRRSRRRRRRKAPG